MGHLRLGGINWVRTSSVCRAFPLRPREYLTFEHVLLDSAGGMSSNDATADARRLVKLLDGLRAKVNLIAWNPGAGLPFRTPSHERVLAFQRIQRSQRALTSGGEQGQLAGRVLRCV